MRKDGYWARKKGSKWYAGVRINGRCTEWATVFTSRKEAEKEAQDHVLNIHRNRHGLPGGKAPGLEPLIEEFLGTYKKQNTHDLYEKHLGIVVAEMRAQHLEQVAQEVAIREFKAKLEGKGHNDGGISITLRILKTFIRYCVEKGYLQFNPFPTKNKDKTPFLATYRSKGRPYSEVEIYKLLTPVFQGLGIPGHVKLAEQRLLVAIRMAFRQGWRLEQVWGFDWARFRAEDQHYLRPAQKKQPEEWVPLHPEVLDAIKTVFGEPQTSGRIFTCWSSPMILSHAFRARRQKLGIVKGRFHDIKHTRITDMKRQGYQPKDIQFLVGNTPESQEFYTHADKSQVSEKFRSEKFDSQKFKVIGE